MHSRRRSSSVRTSQSASTPPFLHASVMAVPFSSLSALRPQSVLNKTHTKDVRASAECLYDFFLSFFSLLLIRLLCSCAKALVLLHDSSQKGTAMTSTSPRKKETSLLSLSSLLSMPLLCLCSAPTVLRVVTAKGRDIQRHHSFFLTNIFFLKPTELPIYLMITERDYFLFPFSIHVDPRADTRQGQRFYELLETKHKHLALCSMYYDHHQHSAISQ